MAKEKKWGVVPFRRKKGKVQVLLITTRNRNWGLPKGNLIKKIGARKTALQEAFEEAGILGRLGERGKKYSPSREDSIFFWPMEVKKELNRWPEHRQRDRKWVTPSKARSMVKKKAARKALELASRN
jgi:8-oxo-dGTP pyrophosphatase MutT (NUDIX family)